MTPTKRPQVYYAHPMSLYGTKIEREDLRHLKRCGFRVYNPNTVSTQKGYEKMGKDFGFFLDLVAGCDVFAFRSLFGGAITSGVAKELEHARVCGLPILELPWEPDQRFLDVASTVRVVKAHKAVNR